MEPFVRRYNLDNRRFALVRTAAADRLASPPAARIDFSFHRIDGVLVGTLHGESFVEGSLLGRFVAADRIEGVIDSGPEGRLTLSLDWQWLWGRTGRGSSLFSEW